jgi:KDO2-lipid IV(A) lauroyltransferase
VAAARHGCGIGLDRVAGCSPTYRRRFTANAAQAGYSLRDVRGAVGAAGS